MHKEGTRVILDRLTFFELQLDRWLGEHDRLEVVRRGLRRHGHGVVSEDGNLETLTINTDFQRHKTMRLCKVMQFCG